MYVHKSMKILGYEIKKGSFKDQDTGNVIDYHNVILHIQKEQSDYVRGICTIQQKIKHSNFIEMLNAARIGIDDLVGMNVNIYYDRFGNPINISKI